MALREKNYIDAGATNVVQKGRKSLRFPAPRRSASHHFLCAFSSVPEIHSGKREERNRRESKEERESKKRARGKKKNENEEHGERGNQDRREADGERRAKRKKQRIRVLFFSRGSCHGVHGKQPDRFHISIATLRPGANRRTIRQKVISPEIGFKTGYFGPKKFSLP